MRAGTEECTHETAKRLRLVIRAVKKYTHSLTFPASCLRLSYWNPVSFHLFCVSPCSVHLLTNRQTQMVLSSSKCSASPSIHTCAWIPAYVWFLIKKAAVVCSRMLLTDALISREISLTHAHSNSSSGRLHHSYFNKGLHSVSLWLWLHTAMCLCVCVCEQVGFVKEALCIQYLTKPHGNTSSVAAGCNKLIRDF